MGRTIKEIWDDCDSDRFEVLDRARKCARLTKPWILPDLGHIESNDLPDNFQSVGSRGVTNLEGKMILALYPPDRPWFRQELAADIRFDPSIPDEQKQDLQHRLFLQDMTVMAVLESAGSTDANARQARGFRTAKRAALTQILVTGETLEYIGDDFRTRCFRRDQYVTRRDSSTDVLFHAIREKIDLLTLTDEQLDLIGLDADDLEDKPAADRMDDLYTIVEWQPRAKAWVIRQEVRDADLDNEHEEEISPYFSTPYQITEGDDYGRAIIEENKGDLGSLDGLCESVLDFAAMASKHHFVIDEHSNFQEGDLLKRNGEVLRARVENGEIQDIASLKVEKTADFSVVHASIERIRKDLGQALLIDSEQVRDSERTTAFEVSQVSLRELEGSLGGVYSPIADRQQMPLIRRVLYQMRRDKLIEPLPNDAVKVKTITGIAALAAQQRVQSIVQLVTAAANLSERARARINDDVLLEVMARNLYIDEPGLIKSREEAMEETREQIRQQLALTAGERGIDAAGTIAEQQAASQDAA